MSAYQLMVILQRQGYRVLPGATPEPCQIWQGPHGRRVLLDCVACKILSKADVERRIVECCGIDTADYYRAVIHNWE